LNEYYRYDLHNMLKTRCASSEHSKSYSQQSITYKHLFFLEDSISSE